MEWNSCVRLRGSVRGKVRVRTRRGVKCARVKVVERVSGRDADRAAGGFVRVGAVCARVCGAQRCARALGANGDLRAARDEGMTEEGTRARYATLSVYDERRRRD